MWTAARRAHAWRRPLAHRHAHRAGALVVLRSLCRSSAFSSGPAMGSSITYHETPCSKVGTGISGRSESLSKCILHRWAHGTHRDLVQHYLPRGSCVHHSWTAHHCWMLFHTSVPLYMLCLLPEHPAQTSLHWGCFKTQCGDRSANPPTSLG